jgi:S1-C subfamily serine protease
VVTWVDPQGPAVGQLNVTDVIVTMGDKSLPGYEQWRARIAQLTAGETVVLGVRRHGEAQTATLTARPMSTPAGPRPLGLTMRTIQRVGVEVLGVTAASAAALARIEPGDVITVIGDRQAPTSEEVRRAFAATSDDRSVLVAVTRGASHHVLLLKKP